MIKLNNSTHKKESKKPLIPPINTIRKVSNKIMDAMFGSVAPRAFLKPISFVRSVTIKNITLATLIPPTANVSKPQKPKKDLITKKIKVIYCSILAKSGEFNARVSVGSK